MIRLRTLMPELSESAKLLFTDNQKEKRGLNEAICVCNDRYVCCARALAAIRSFLVRKFINDRDAVWPRAIDLHKLVEPHLELAVEQSNAAIPECLKPVDDFFDRANSGSRGFAEDVLGWGSKMRLVADHVPFTEKGRHDRFVRASFEKHLFSADDLQKLLVQCVEQYTNEVENIENQMLVAIRADIADLPDHHLASLMDSQSLDEQIQAAFNQAIASTQNGLQGDAAALIASQIAQKLLTRIAVRLGASASILSVGAAGAPISMGLSLLAGVILDQIVSYVWDWWADPTGQLSTQFQSKLDQIRSLVVDGDSEVQGLKQQLVDLSEIRTQTRNEVIAGALSKTN